MAKVLRGVDAVGGIVGARIDATWLGQPMAEIARRCLAFGHTAAWVQLELRRHRLHADASVRTVFGAQSTPNAPILNHHFQSVATAD